MFNGVVPGNFGEAGRLDVPGLKVRRVEFRTPLYEEVSLNGLRVYAR
jgi:hypothetical protein